jgi:hypothetical protein
MAFIVCGCRNTLGQLDGHVFSMTHRHRAIRGIRVTSDFEIDCERCHTRVTVPVAKYLEARLVGDAEIRSTAHA